jgi:hypothetical protein
MMAKKITQAELDKLRRKKGVSVKRKMGAQKKSEPVAKKDKAMSGAASAKQSAPVTAKQPVDTKPYAAMAASIAVSQKNIEELIRQNTLVINDFRKKLMEDKPVQKVAYRHTVVRDRSNLIEEVISSPMETKE